MTDVVDICDRVVSLELREGGEALNEHQRTLYWLYTFQCDYENGGLSGFFYNHDEDLRGAGEAAADAMRAAGAACAAELLREAAALFRSGNPVEGDPAYATWADYLARVDPKGRLDEIDQAVFESELDLFEMIEAFVRAHESELLWEPGVNR